MSFDNYDDPSLLFTYSSKPAMLLLVLYGMLDCKSTSGDSRSNKTKRQTGTGKFEMFNLPVR